jgi:hypothetical protein
MRGAEHRFSNCVDLIVRLLRPNNATCPVRRLNSASRRSLEETIFERRTDFRRIHTAPTEPRKLHGLSIGAVLPRVVRENGLRYSERLQNGVFWVCQRGAAASPAFSCLTLRTFSGASAALGLLLRLVFLGLPVLCLVGHSGRILPQPGHPGASRMFGLRVHIAVHTEKDGIEKIGGATRI